MRDEDKTKEQLITELAELRQQVAELEASETEHKRVEEQARKSEERYGALYESSHDGIAAASLDGRITECNQAYAEMLGYSREELKRIRYQEIMPSKWHAFDEDVFREVMERGYSYEFEEEYIRKGGTVFPVSLRTWRMDDEAGNPIGVWFIVRDITARKRVEEELRKHREQLEELAEERTAELRKEIGERKQAEEALRESEERLGAFMESAPDAFSLFDSELDLVEINRAGVEMFPGGTRKEDVIGKNITELYPSMKETGRYDKYLEVIKTGKSFFVDDVVPHPSFGDIHLSVRAFKVAGGLGIIVTDITERSRAEEEIRRLSQFRESIIDNANVWLDVLDAEANVVVWNKAAEEISGYSYEEVVGYGKIWEWLYPDEEYRNEVIAEAVAIIEKGKEERDSETTIRRKDGQTRIISWNSRSLVDENGTPIGSIALGRDITGRKRAEEERDRLLMQIQEQARQVQQIIDTVPEGVLLLNADGRLVLANPVAEGALVVLAGAKVGDTLTHLGDCPMAELLTSPPKGLWHEVRAGGRTFEIIARPMENGPEPESWVLVINDVTEEREIRRRVQRQERLAAVGELAAGIAHDFNNVMAVIVLYAQMTARAEGCPARVRERMETIDQQAKHATKLIQQILDFSRRAVLKRQLLDLLPLLKEQVKLLERTLPENIEIVLDYGPDEYTVHADLTRMQQMMTNLAVNARDAMPEGGNLRIGLERIEVRPGESPLLPEMEAGEWVQLTVSDTGTGIPPDVMPHIFDPFFTTKTPLGSGLGLAQVYGIVAQHEGRIDVETQVGEGTTFTIYLPALQVQPVETPIAERRDLVEGHGETVLVVEDDATVRMVLVGSLETLNYRPLEAANGQEALTVLEQHAGEIALVLSDVVMPGMGGIALFHAMKQRGLAVPVVMLTGHQMKGELKSLRARGLSDWLLKPPDMEQLAKVVARALKEDPTSS